MFEIHRKNVEDLQFIDLNADSYSGQNFFDLLLSNFNTLYANLYQNTTLNDKQKVKLSYIQLFYGNSLHASPKLVQTYEKYFSFSLNITELKSAWEF